MKIKHIVWMITNILAIIAIREINKQEFSIGLGMLAMVVSAVIIINIVLAIKVTVEYCTKHKKEINTFLNKKII